MKYLIFPTLLFFGFLQSGCARKSEVEEIKQNLGAIQYAGLTPNVTATIQKKTLIKAEAEYGSPRLLISGLAKQEGEFPLDNYMVQIWVGVYIHDQKVGRGYLGFEMVNGNGAFSEEVTLYEARGSVIAGNPPVTLKPEVFDWSPKDDKLSKLKLNDTESE